MPSKRLLSALFCSTLALSCALAALVVPSAHAQTPADTSAGGDAAVASSEQQLLAEADEIARTVGQLRGLALRDAIVKGVKQRDELRAVLLEKLSEEVTDAEIENESKVFKRLGLFAPEVDYKQMMLDMLTEQIAGFYDQESKELYIMEGIPLDLQRPAMAHEIFHAIQDQHFDIGAMLEPFTSRENGDFALARMALVEGDATVLMIDFTLQEQGVLPQPGGINSIVDLPMMAALLLELDFSSLIALEQLLPQGGPEMEGSLQDSALANAPPIVRELLVFPYFGGMRFVMLARSGRTWADFDTIYADAPVSTEQILHPERYFEGDYPTQISYRPHAALPGYRPIYDTVLGELQMLLWLKTHIEYGPAAAEAEAEAAANTDAPQQGDGADGAAVDIGEAAKGWGGDRLLGFEDEQGNVLVTHLSSWDSIDDAREYFDAQVAVVTRRYPDARVSRNQGDNGQSLCLHREVDGRFERLYLEQWGDMVLYIEGAPSAPDADGAETDATLYTLRDRVWKTFRRTPFEQAYQQRLDELERAKRAGAAAPAGDSTDTP